MSVFLLAAIARDRSTERGCHVACALIGTNATASRSRRFNATASRSRRFNGYQECGCPSCKYKQIKNLPAHRKDLQRFWLNLHDHYRAVTQPYNFVAEIHLASGVVSAFVFPSAAIAWALSSTFKVSLPQRLWPPSELQPVASRLPGVRLPLEYNIYKYYKIINFISEVIYSWNL